MLQALAAFVALAVAGAGVVVIVTWEPPIASRSATLATVDGRVEGRSAGSTVFQTATEGARLGAGDSIRTTPGASAEIEYFEGSISRLDASTTVQMEEIASGSDPPGPLITLRQPVGRSYHLFEGGDGTGGRFRVMTPTSIVTARGGEFTVTVGAGGSTIYRALDGDLSILTLGGPVTVEANDGLEVSSGGAPGRPYALTGEELEDAWLANARCEAEDAEGEICPSVEVPGEIGVTPGPTPSVLPPPIPAPSPGATVTPPGVLPSPTPTRDRPPSPRPTSTTSPPGPGRDVVPQTRITAGPGRLTNASNASFGFGSTPRGASFQCRLDGGAWRGCSSPQSYGPLDEGRYRFTVRALSSGGRADPTPASYTWTIDRTRPETVIEDGPSSTTSQAQVTFRFRAAEGKLRFECSLDGGAFRFCSSPTSYEVSANGSHTFQVRAIDRAGNIELTPAARTWHKT